MTTKGLMDKVSPHQPAVYSVLMTVLADTSLDDGEPDEEGRFFGGGLNTEQRVCPVKRKFVKMLMWS